MDEPCSALDPIATFAIEELMLTLAERYTIVIVTHNMYQASRVSNYTGFFLLGELVEYGPTPRIFDSPSTSAPTTTSGVASASPVSRTPCPRPRCHRPRAGRSL